jgi:hypothetical protein
VGCQECASLGASGGWHHGVKIHGPSSPHRGDTQAPERLTGFTEQTQELAGDLALIFDEAFDLLLRKHENYGPMNVAGAPGHKKPTAINGLLVRMHDKQARILKSNVADSVTVLLSPDASVGSVYSSWRSSPCKIP